MTDDLSALGILRPEVRDAVAAIDTGNGVFVRGDDCEGGIAWATVRAELLRLAKIEEERWAVVATRNGALERAEKAEAELAASKDKYQQDDGMAACMAMVRDECIKAGVFPDSLAPMFYPEAIIGMHAELAALKTRIDK